MSVRSSTDEVITQTNPINRPASSKNLTGNDLDFFFNMITAPPTEKTMSKLGSANQDYLDSDRNDKNIFTDMIKPLKDDKLIKLKSSVDNLRRELEVETLKNEQENKILKNQIGDLKRIHLAARKIQRWYRAKMKAEEQRKNKEIQE
jgi:hypothetical protein